MTKDEALKMAIEAFVRWEDTYKADCTEVINACKEALEQPAQEPVAWYWDNHHRDKIPYVGVERGNPKLDAIFGTPMPLYTHPHQWQGLTDKERYLNDGRTPEEIEYAIAIEAKLKDKNT